MAQPDQISFEPEPEVEASEGEISFTPSTEEFKDDDIPSSVEDIDARAEKAEIAEKGFDGRTVLGQQENADAILSGFEGAVRSRLLTKANQQERERKMEFIRKTAVDMNTSLSPFAIQEFLGFTPDELTNPKTIRESQFAKEMIATLDGQASIAEDALAHDAMLTSFEGIIRKKEFLQTTLEKFEKRAEGRVFLQKAQNFVGEIVVPLRQRIGLRGAQTQAGVQGPVDESFVKSVFLEEASTVLMLATNEAFVDNVEKTSEFLWQMNPDIAITWLREMTHRSSSDDFLTDLFDAVDVSSIIDIPLIGAAVGRRLLLGAGRKKALKGVVKQAKTLGLKPTAKKGKGKSKPRTAGVPQGPEGRAFLNKLVEMLRVNGNRKLSIPDIENARGAPTRAAARSAVKELREGLYTNLSTTNSKGFVDRLLNDLPTLMTPGRVTSGVSKASREEKRRITAILNANADLALRAATRTRLVNGRPQAAIEQGLEEALDKFRPNFKGAGNDIIDIVDITPIGSTTNVLTAGVRIGYNGKAFKGVDAADAISQATRHAEDILGLDKDAFKIVQKGDNFFIQAFVPIDETTPLFRAQLVAAAPTPLSYRNMLGSLLFGNDEQVSAAFRANAKVSVLAQNNYSAFAKEIFKPIRTGMTRKQKKDLEHYLETQRVHERFDAAGNFQGVGRFDDTVGQFERNFEKVNGRFPEANETLGYFTYRQLNDLDLLTNNFGVYRDKARQGIQQHILQVESLTDVSADGLPRLVSAEAMEGKAIGFDEMQIAGDTRVLFHNPVSPDLNGRSLTKLHIGSELGEAELSARVKEILEDGGQLIKLNGDGQRVAEKVFAKDLAGDIPDFIVTARSETKPLALSQIPNSPGGHNIYPDGSFLKQGRLVPTATDFRYAGDRAIVNLPFHPDAVKLAKTMEDIRSLLKIQDGKLLITDSTAFRAAVARTPFGVSRVKKWFTPNKQGESFLSPDVKIYAARSGERTSKLADNYREGLLGRSVRVKKNSLDEGVSTDFTTHRDRPLPTVVNKGTEDSPLYDVRKTQFVPPFATLQQSLDTIAANRFMDDFKFRAQDQFFAEFGDLLEDVGEVSGLQHALFNPLDAALNGKLKTVGVDAKRLTAARGQQRILKQILGLESDTQRSIRQNFQKTIDALYSKLGKHGERAVKLVPDSALPLLQDPAQYMRNMAFHMKLGLFNPVQLWLQAQGSILMVGIAGPKIGWAAAPAAAQFMRLGFTNNKGIIKQFAKNHSKMGKGFSWKASEFEEAYLALSESGFMRVGGEQAFRNTQRAARLDRGRAGTFLDKSSMLFDMGEQFNRTMGYAGSYRRWRNANPKAKFDLVAQDLVLDMADTMSGNMTRVSNAAWQKGFLSIPTQFFAYQARIAELMLPKFLGGASRITTIEKWRMFATFSVMYGVPTAAGTLTAVVPFYDVVREELLKRGLANPDTGNAVVDEVLFFLHQGFVSTAMRMAGFGHDVNFAQRYGPGGLDIFKDWLDGDKSTFEVMTGVSGSVLTDVWQSFEPLRMTIVNAFSGDPVNFKMLALDLSNLVSDVSTGSAMLRFYIGITTEQYYTKNTTLLNDQEQDWLETTITSLTGLTRLDIADDFLRIKLGRIRKAAQREGIKTIGQLLRRAFVPGTSDELRDGLINRAGHLGTALQLDERQKKLVLKQNLSGANLASTTAVQFSKSFGGGSEEKFERLLRDSQRGRE